jgi:glycosyltransferase involved in cell wall biosynthesis
MSDRTKLSVVVPLFNEEESVEPLVCAVTEALGSQGPWELVLVDDGSVDRTAALAAELSASDSRVRLIRLARNYGQTPAMQAGFDHARGDIIVTMDGDLQNDPGDIVQMVAKIDEGYEDKFITRKVPSWVANRIIRAITGVPIRDNGCSLKAYRKDLLERLHLYSDMHRFLPAVAAATAGARITEVPVRHHSRRYGTSKYGLSRVFKVLGDLLTIKMIRSFRERPLAMLATGALFALLLAAAFGAATLIAVGFQPEKAAAVVFPGAALLWLGLAGYLLLLGLVAEVALRKDRGTNGAQAPLTREVYVAQRS